MWVNAMSEKIVAFVLLVTEIGREHEVVDRIGSVCKDVGVGCESYVVYGEYDVLVKLLADNLKKIDQAVTRIRKLSGVLRTVTLIAST